MGKALFRGRGSRIARGGASAAIDYVLSYRRPAPRPIGYRGWAAVTLDDLLARLRTLGYAPRAEACDDAAEVVGPADPAAPLVGAHVRITDPHARGGIRLQLPDLGAGDRRLGALAIGGDDGSAAAELGLFTLRALADLLADLEAARGDSALAPVPIALLTAALPDRPERR